MSPASVSTCRRCGRGPRPNPESGCEASAHWAFDDALAAVRLSATGSLALALVQIEAAEFHLVNIKRQIQANLGHIQGAP